MLEHPHAGARHRGRVRGQHLLDPALLGLDEDRLGAGARVGAHIERAVVAEAEDERARRRERAHQRHDLDVVREALLLRHPAVPRAQVREQRLERLEAVVGRRRRARRRAARRRRGRREGR